MISDCPGAPNSVGTKSILPVTEKESAKSAELTIGVGYHHIIQSRGFTGKIDCAGYVIR